VGVDPFSVFLRLGEGTSGVDGVERGEDAAALCMNFMVNRREDMVFGCGVVVPDIVSVWKGDINNVFGICDSGVVPVD